jgi:glycosyltransferase involved in cell wall biosynthesis
MNRLIYPEVRDYLVEAHGFIDVPLFDGEDNPLSTWERMRTVLRSPSRFIARLRELREGRVIVSALKNVNIILKLLARLRVIRPQRHYCYGFFSHSPKALAWLRWAALLDGEDDIYIVFTEEEARRYSEVMRVPPHRLVVLPYSDWDQAAAAAPAAFDPAIKQPRYYFSGGYSNRDYAALIDVFRSLPDRLIIACSRINTEMAEIELPPNVEVRRDIPIGEFDALISGATACILPIRDRASVAGQSVVVNCLKHHTPVIITDTPVVREYITDGVSGFLVDDMAAVPALLGRLDPAGDAYRAMVETGHRIYQERFSHRAVASRLAAILARA